MKAWIPWTLKGAFIALAVVLDRSGMLSPALTDVLVTAVGGTALAGVVATYGTVSRGAAAAALRDVLEALKQSASSPDKMLAAIGRLEAIAASLKGSAATPAAKP